MIWLNSTYLHATHRGKGLAESEVKVIKSHLEKISANTAGMTIRQIDTLLKRVEAVINSRPIAVIKPNDGRDPYVVTPAHFWADRPLVACPSGPIMNEKGHVIELTKKSKQSDDMIAQFWEVVRDNHFHELQTRKKWHKSHENLKIGDVVLLKEYGIVRVVTVKNALGHIHQRATTEMVSLPVAVDLEIPC